MFPKEPIKPQVIVTNSSTNSARDRKIEDLREELKALQLQANDRYLLKEEEKQNEKTEGSKSPIRIEALDDDGEPLISFPKKIVEKTKKDLEQKARTIQQLENEQALQARIADLNKLKVVELQKLLKSRGVKFDYRSSKADLVNLVIDYESDGSKIEIEDGYYIPSPKQTPNPTPRTIKPRMVAPIIFESESDQEGDGKKSLVDEKGLSTLQINEIMGRYPEYLGTIPSDGIPLLLPKVKPNTRVCFIMNSDPSGKPGEHWVAVLIDARPGGSRSIEFYNPLGIKDRRRLTSSFLTNIIPLLEKINPSEKPLRLKENLIADQNNTSANCGQFSIKFLLDRLVNNKTFAEASGYDRKGEKMIEKFKEEFYPFRLISQNGRGLLDYLKKGYQYVKGRVVKAFDTAKGRAKDVITNGLRRDYPPRVRNIISEYGSRKITGIRVCRKPIHSFLKKVLDTVTGGKFSDNLKGAGYDEAMHLFMLVKLDNNIVLQCEKNEVISIKTSKWDTDAEMKEVSAPQNRSFGDFLQKGRDSVSPEAFFLYDSRNYNCQHWISVLLKANGLMTSDLSHWINQPAEKIYEGLGLLGIANKAVTDLAAGIDHVIYGRGGDPGYDMEVDPVTRRYRREPRKN